MRRLIRTTAVLVCAVAVILGSAAGVAAFAPSSPWLASAHARSLRAVPRSAFTVSHAPAGLQAAVRRTLGACGPCGGWSQQAKLTASDAAEGDFAGSAVAIDGVTAVVGAPDKNSRTGAAYVFVRSGSAWREQAKLTASDGAEADAFGVTVGISGETVLVGAPGKNSGRGAAYVFVRSGSAWREQAELAAPATILPAAFGEAVAVSGPTAVVSAPAERLRTGAAYVFTRSGRAWSRQARLAAADGARGDSFGSLGEVAISGTTVLVGAPGNNSDKGAAYVFARSGRAWSQQARLTAADGLAGDRFGWSVAISGSTAVVSAAYKNDQTGAAYVFARSGKRWSQQAKLTASDAVELDLFGYSVAISGKTVLAGVPRSKEAADVFVRSGNTWSQQARLIGDDSVPGDVFGTAVAISGKTALVGAPFKSEDTGAAYVFARLSALPVTG